MFLVALMVQPALAQQAGEPGKFDYYVLSLSWSPTWCSGDPAREATSQCQRSFGFIIHGLWPQHARGGYPAACAMSAPVPVPEAVVQDMLPVMPSRALIGHQWRKHGTCQGGAPSEYFAATRIAHERLRIPDLLAAPDAPVRLSVDEIKRLFAEANPGLSPRGMAVICRGDRAAEVRVCLDRDLDFRQCGQDVRNRCRGEAVFPALR